MSDSEKPFACTIAGCNMSFVNEDHLTVHKKKHDMMLNLGINNKNNLFIADQTPTPTRFIRNCDEVGLFQDLQNENPFEETFRRAVEAGKTGVLTVPDVDENDDTLHTPNVFPHLTEECATTSMQRKGNITKSENKSFTESTNLEQTLANEIVPIDIPEKSNCEIVQNSSDSSNVNDVMETKTHLPLNGAEMQLLLKTQDGKVLRFVATPAVNNQINSVNVQTEIKTEIKAAESKDNQSHSRKGEKNSLSVAKMKLKQALTKNDIVSENKSEPDNENENDLMEYTKQEIRDGSDYSKKQAILERNRASSMRSRAKRKAWIEQLQQSLKKANETNAMLHSQVKSLNLQVEKLKTLLLAHKDCPITKAMEKGNGTIVSSKVLTIKPNEMKQVSMQVPVIAGYTKSTKRHKQEKLITPRKKPLILSSVKNPMILPKTDGIRGVEVIKPVPTINIVTPVVANSENGKTIVGFLHPESGKVPVIQDTFVINGNFNQSNKTKITDI